MYKPTSGQKQTQEPQRTNGFANKTPIAAEAPKKYIRLPQAWNEILQKSILTENGVTMLIICPVQGIGIEITIKDKRVIVKKGTEDLVKFFYIMKSDSFEEIEKQVAELQKDEEHERKKEKKGQEPAYLAIFIKFLILRDHYAELEESNILRSQMHELILKMSTDSEEKRNFIEQIEIKDLRRQDRSEGMFIFFRPKIESNAKIKDRWEGIGI